MICLCSPLRTYILIILKNTIGTHKPLESPILEQGSKICPVGHTRRPTGGVDCAHEVIPEVSSSHWFTRSHVNPAIHVAIPFTGPPQINLQDAASNIHSTLPSALSYYLKTSLSSAMPPIEAKPLRQPQSRFLSLPAELIFAIIAHLSDDRRTLCALARTCHLVHPHCEEYIYRTIELRETRDLEAICMAFNYRPERVAAVHKLGILYKHRKGRFGRSLVERHLFNGSVSRMTSLRDWHIESPFDNFKWGEPESVEWVEKDMESFRQCLEGASLREGQELQQDVGLAKLEKRTSTERRSHPRP